MFKDVYLKVRKNVTSGIIYDYNHPLFKVLICINNSKLGPALGGCRLMTNISRSEALKDVKKLAEAMTFKNAVVDLPYGGGKAFIYHSLQSRNDMFRHLAELLNFLNGKFLTADDVNVSIRDMEFMRKYTPYAHGVYDKTSGVQIPATAYGIFRSIQQSLLLFSGDKSLKNKKIFVLGLGKVGYGLSKFLTEADAEVFGYDIDSNKMKIAKQDLGINLVDANYAFSEFIDVFSPCALGGVITKNNVEKINADFIVGGANNILVDESLDEKLSQRGIIYIPDFLSNAGGVLDIFCEGKLYSKNYVFNCIEIIPNKIEDFYNKAKNNKTTILQVAKKYVIDKLK